MIGNILDAQPDRQGTIVFWFFRDRIAIFNEHDQISFDGFFSHFDGVVVRIALGYTAGQRGYRYDKAALCDRFQLNRVR